MVNGKVMIAIIAPNRPPIIPNMAPNRPNVTPMITPPSASQSGAVMTAMSMRRMVEEDDEESFRVDIAEGICQPAAKIIQRIAVHLKVPESAFLMGFNNSILAGTVEK